VAKDLEERVAPLAALYDEAKRQNEELLNRLQLLQSTGATYKSDAFQAKEIAELHRHEERRLRERAKDYITIIKEKNLEVESLRMELKERDKRVCIFVHMSNFIDHNPGGPLEDEVESISKVTTARIHIPYRRHLSPCRSKANSTCFFVRLHDATSPVHSRQYKRPQCSKIPILLV